MNCKKCLKKLNDFDIGLFETTKERYCYDCQMKRLTNLEKNLDKTKEELNFVLLKYA